MSPSYVLMWEAAGQAGFAGPAHWTKWADERILQCQGAPAWWLGGLSLASSLDAIADLARRVITSGEVGSKAIVDAEAAFTGYLYLRHKRGDYDLATALIDVGDSLDGSVLPIPCEQVYDLARRLQGAAAAGQALIREEADAMLALFVDEACKQWQTLTGERIC